MSNEVAQPVPGEQSQADEAPNTISLKHFFEGVAPGLQVPVSDAFDVGPNGFTSSTILRVSDIELHCTNDACQGTRFFFYESGEVNFTRNIPTNHFLSFVCRNCNKTRKFYAVCGTLGSRSGDSVFMKFGEIPAFGPPTPRRLMKLIQDDYDLFLKGRWCEMQGLGIGAFVYYRRIVENHKHKLFEAIIKACNRVNVDEALITELEAAKKETQFTRAVEVIQHSLPSGLLINGENPLMLLHEALSEGVHGLSDADCLDLAVMIRTVLAGLSEKISQLMTDDDELKAAAAKLAQRREAKRLAKEAATTPESAKP